MEDLYEFIIKKGYNNLDPELKNLIDTIVRIHEAFNQDYTLEGYVDPEINNQSQEEIEYVERVIDPSTYQNNINYKSSLELSLKNQEFNKAYFKYVSELVSILDIKNIVAYFEPKNEKEADQTLDEMLEYLTGIPVTQQDKYMRKWYEEIERRLSNPKTIKELEKLLTKHRE